MNISLPCHFLIWHLHQGQSMIFGVDCDWSSQRSSQLFWSISYHIISKLSWPWSCCNHPRTKPLQFEEEHHHTHQNSTQMTRKETNFTANNATMNPITCKCWLHASFEVFAFEFCDPWKEWLIHDQSQFPSSVPTISTDFVIVIMKEYRIDEGEMERSCKNRKPWKNVLKVITW